MQISLYKFCCIHNIIQMIVCFIVRSIVYSIIYSIVCSIVYMIYHGDSIMRIILQILSSKFYYVCHTDDHILHIFDCILLYIDSIIQIHCVKSMRLSFTLSYIAFIVCTQLPSQMFQNIVAGALIETHNL